MARPLIVIPEATSSSRTCCGGGPILAMPSPETSMIRRSAVSGSRRNAACAASSASPIAVSPFELRRVARTLLAKALALAASLMRVQSTVTTCLSRSDHSSTSTSIAPLVPPAMAAMSGSLSKARAMPSCCSSYSSASTLSETSTARTSATSTGAARAGLGPSSRASSRPPSSTPRRAFSLASPMGGSRHQYVEQQGRDQQHAHDDAGDRKGRVGGMVSEVDGGKRQQGGAHRQAHHHAKQTPVTPQDASLRSSLCGGRQGLGVSGEMRPGIAVGARGQGCRGVADPGRHVLDEERAVEIAEQHMIPFGIKRNPLTECRPAGQALDELRHRRAWHDLVMLAIENERRRIEPAT